MYVRIVHDDLEDLYHCGRVTFSSHTEEEDAVHVDMEGVPQLGQLTHLVHKGDGEVYVMNDDGQTIDSYVWTE